MRNVLLNTLALVTSTHALFECVGTNTGACEVLYKTVLGLALGSPESGPPSGSPSGPPSARLGSGGGRSPALLPRTETAPPETPAELVSRLDASVAEFYATEDTAGEANWPRRPR